MHEDKTRFRIVRSMLARVLVAGSFATLGVFFAASRAEAGDGAAQYKCNSGNSCGPGSQTYCTVGCYGGLGCICSTTAPIRVT